MVRKLEASLPIFRRKNGDEAETEKATPKETPGRRLMKYRPYTYPKDATKRSRSKSRERTLFGKSDVNKDPLLKVSTAKSTGSKRALSSPRNSKAKSGYVPPAPSETSSDRSKDDEGRYKVRDGSDDAATASSSDHATPAATREKIAEILNPRLSEITSSTFSYADSATLSTFGAATDGDTTFGQSTGTYGDGTTMTYGDDTFDGTTKDEDDGQTLSTSYTHELEQDFTNARLKSESTMEDGLWSVDKNRVFYQQKVAFASIFVSSLQLGLMLIQLILCGVATIDVNPMIGPYPDAFSEWGGKNAYLLLDEHQYFRLFTPVLLHVGVLHMLVNAVCQLETCALFEREWGSGTWLIAYIVSGIGAVATSCVLNPDEIGVSSSGALMGLFGAKMAQFVTYKTFELDHKYHLLSVAVDQMAGVLCSTSVICLLGLVTYIDLSGHLGGFVSGFLVGILLFCNAIASTCKRFMWAMLGITGLIGGGVGLNYLLWVETYPDDELGDACQYFRNLYPEGYDCECKWG